MVQQLRKDGVFSLSGLVILLITVGSFAFPSGGYNKVAYYTFDATPVGQDFMSLTDFTDNANIVVVFEGTLWELADTVHYDTKWMRNRIYTTKKKILDDIRTLQERGLAVLMNVDDAATWSTETPFTTWDGKKLNYREFAAFVDSCADVVGFDGISLDVEHKAVDNMHYRNMIKELGKYFGPLSSDSLTKMYIGAVYESRYGVPGEIFREEELSRYLNFVMDMGYTHEDRQRFDFWANHLGSRKVMLGMSHQDNDLERAVDWIARNPAPETAGIMVYAANVNKMYTDSIFSALGDEPVENRVIPERKSPFLLYVEHRSGKIEIRLSLKSDAKVSLKLISVSGRVHTLFSRKHCSRGRNFISLSMNQCRRQGISPGAYYALIEIKGNHFSDPKLLMIVE